MAQAGLNDEKTGGLKSRWTVPLNKFKFNYETPYFIELEKYEKTVET